MPENKARLYLDRVTCTSCDLQYAAVQQLNPILFCTPLSIRMNPPHKPNIMLILVLSFITLVPET